MKAAIYLYEQNNFSEYQNNDALNKNNTQLVLAFGAKSVVQESSFYNLLKSKFNNANIAICSTAGEIYATNVKDDSATIVAFEFEKTNIVCKQLNITNSQNSFTAGEELIKQLSKDELSYVLVLSDGNVVNGSELVRGLNSIAENVPITGGLAGDGVNFTSTLVGLNATPTEGNIVVIGFYGKHLKVGHGVMGGWDMFGLERTVTKSKSNQLFEIDNKNALDLYKMYLGNYVNELPSSALLFPLSVLAPGSTEPVVRTILKIDEETNSMIFAGDIPENSQVRFMRANFDKLIDAATSAANASFESLQNNTPKVALLISCVGRKAILGLRTEEEVEAVDKIFGGKTLLTGFYSYGEISPFNNCTNYCELHNQTMTITTFNED